MLYVNMHFIVTGLTFLVTMYGQSFLFCTQSIRHVLGMSHLINHLPTLFPKVHALTRKELDVILVSFLAFLASYIFTSPSLNSPSQHGFWILFPTYLHQHH